MTSTGEAKPKRTRKRTGTLSKQRTLRFGATEEAAIEAVPFELSKTGGKTVSFSEAHHLIRRMPHVSKHGRRRWVPRP